MLKGVNIYLVTTVLGIAYFSPNTAQPQTIQATPSVALKSGESFELSDAYFISTLCKSLLISLRRWKSLTDRPA
jgi:hypothetical protein